MKKLSDLYTPGQAKSHLLKTFCDSPLVANKINQMNDKQLQVFACSDGLTIAEHGRDLKADAECVAIEKFANEFGLSEAVQ